MRMWSIRTWDAGLASFHIVSPRSSKCLAHSRCSRKICWVNSWIRDLNIFLTLCFHDDFPAWHWILRSWRRSWSPYPRSRLMCYRSETLNKHVINQWTVRQRMWVLGNSKKKIKLLLGAALCLFSSNGYRTAHCYHEDRYICRQSNPYSHFPHDGCFWVIHRLSPASMSP